MQAFGDVLHLKKSIQSCALVFALLIFNKFINHLHILPSLIKFIELVSFVLNHLFLLHIFLLVHWAALRNLRFLFHHLILLETLPRRKCLYDGISLRHVLIVVKLVQLTVRQLTINILNIIVSVEGRVAPAVSTSEGAPTTLGLRSLPLREGGVACSFLAHLVSQRHIVECTSHALVDLQLLHASIVDLAVASAPRHLVTIAL